MIVLHGIDKNKGIILKIALSGALSIMLFLASLALSGMLPGQKYSFLTGDGFTQVLPFSKLFFRNILGGGSLGYSFEIGMGMPTAAVYAFYVMSPFNALWYLIPDAEIAGIIILCLKLMCISGSMCMLINRLYGEDTPGSISLSVAYGLCSYFCSFCLSFFLLDMLYILPLVALGLLRLLKKGRWGLLCLVYTYSFVVHFYSAYITGIFSLLLFIVMAVHMYEKKLVLWKKALMKYLLTVVIAVLFAAPLLIPAAYELFSLRTTDAFRMDEFVLYPWSFICGLCPGYSGIMQGLANSAPLMYAGIPVLLLTVVFFFDNGNSKKEKILASVLLVFLTLCSFVKPLYLFMHAFDAPNFYFFRFSWIVSFCMVLLSAKELRNMQSRNVEKKYVIVSGTVWIVLYFIVLFVERIFNMQESSALSLSKGGLISGLIIVYVVVLTGVFSAKLKRILFGCLLSAELCVNLMTGLGYLQIRTVDRAVFDIEKENALRSKQFIAGEEEQDPWGFYRVSYHNSLRENLSMVYDFNGLGWFSSVENEKVRNVLKKYGYFTEPVCACDYGSTPFMQMIFAQKYEVDCGFALSDQRDYYDFGRNDKVLPLGFMVSDDILGYSTSEQSPFAAQNALATAMCGSKQSVFKEYNGNVLAEITDLEFIQYEEGTKVRLTSEAGGAVFSVAPEQEGQVYAYMGRWGISETNNTEPLLVSDLDIGGITRLSRVTMPHIIPLGKDDEGVCKLYLHMNSDSAKAFDYEDLYFAYADEEGLSNVYNELAGGRMEVRSFKDDCLEAAVSVEGDKKVLFTSIPYSKDWEVYVDGEKAQTLALLDDAFVGVCLDEGKHDLEFRYSEKLRIPGILCMITGVVSMAVLILWKKYGQGNNKDCSQVDDNRL